MCLSCTCHCKIDTPSTLYLTTFPNTNGLGAALASSEGSCMGSSENAGNLCMPPRMRFVNRSRTTEWTVRISPARAALAIGAHTSNTVS